MPKLAVADVPSLTYASAVGESPACQTTLTLTGPVVAVPPELSVAFAVIECAPAAALFQVTL